MEFFSRTSWGPQASGTSTSSTGKRYWYGTKGSHPVALLRIYSTLILVGDGDPPWWLSGRGGAGHGGKPFLHARKRCAHNVVNRFPLTQFCRLLPDLCCQTFLLHKARAVRGPMISSRGMRPAACSTLRTSQTCSPRRRDQKNASVEKIKGWAKSRLALSKMTISPGADGGQSSIGTLGVIWGGMRAASSARAANLEFTPSLAVLCRSPAASPRYCRASP
jgi:hypothetical protein